jgi:hypothetical protein
MKQINTANSAELTILNNRVDTEYNNMYPDTSDADTLSRFEKDNGLTIMPNYDLSYRRTRIYSKLIGQGDFSVGMIKSIAKVFVNGDVDATLDIPNFTITIKFISVYGIPPNLDDFKEAIEEVKPAYFLVNYEFTYELWSEVSNFNWEDVSNYTWQDIVTKPLQTNVTQLYSQLSDGSYAKIQFISE